MSWHVSGRMPCWLIVSLILLLQVGCSDVPRLDDELLLPVEPGRMAVPEGYFRGLADDLARDFRENRSLDRLRFLPDDAWLRWERIFIFLFNSTQGLDVGVENFYEQALSDGWRVRFQFVLRGFTAVGRLESGFCIPVDWRFRLEDRVARLVADGLVTARILEIRIETNTETPLEGVRILQNGKILSTTDDNGLSLVVLNSINEERLDLIREGFQPGQLQIPAGSREVRIQTKTLTPLPGAFIPVVDDLRVESGDQQIRLRWHYPHAVDRFLILRRDNGHFAPLIELPAGTEEFLDTQELINGRRSFYRVQPSLTGRASLPAPVIAGIPSKTVIRMQWEDVLLEPARGSRKGHDPWIERNAVGFRDVYLCLRPGRTEKIQLLSDQPVPAGVYAVLLHARKEPAGGRLQISLGQFGDSEGVRTETPVVDLKGGSPHPVRLELGQISYKPVNWQDNPVTSAVLSVEIKTLPPVEERERLTLDCLELIRLN